MSPRTTPNLSPFLTASPSLAFKTTSVSLSRSSKVRLNTSSPAIIPSCLQIKSTSPCWYSLITEFVVISSLVISSRRALIISSSAFSCIVILFIVFLLLFYSGSDRGFVQPLVILIRAVRYKNLFFIRFRVRFSDLPCGAFCKHKTFKKGIAR